MENKENTPSCLVRGPGPAYKLPPLVGYAGHDPSRQRGPAYSIRFRVDARSDSVGPGPCYNINKLTKYGIDKSPAYTIGSKDPERVYDLGPGPGAYNPEQCKPMNHNIRAPAYSIKSKSRDLQPDHGPGPNVYTIPTCIGPKIPDKQAQGAYTIGGYHERRQESLGPGPAAYANLNQNTIKKRNPAYSLKWRHMREEEYVSPGPCYYPSYSGARRAPKYSFGLKHSECAGNPITSLDEED